MASPTPPEKGHASDGSNLGPGVENNRDAEIAHIDAIATAPDTTLDSFAHLDEKKILRKVRH